MSFPIATDPKPDAGMSNAITALVSVFAEQVISGVAVFNVTEDLMKFILSTIQLAFKENIKAKDHRETNDRVSKRTGETSKKNETLH